MGEGEGERDVGKAAQRCHRDGSWLSDIGTNGSVVGGGDKAEDTEASPKEKAADQYRHK